MTTAFLQLLVSLAAGIGIIILLTAKYRIPAFFALFLACFLVGWGVQLPVPAIISAMKDGFGNILKSLGFIIVLGTLLGVILEYTGGTRVMAAFILRLAGEKNAALAMGITGFIVGLPIFCDSGYIVLSGLNKSVAARTRVAMVTMSVSLAAGLYAVHCLIPPHPGATAAAGMIRVSPGLLMLTGIAVAIPAAIAGCWWAAWAGKKLPDIPAVTTPEMETIPRIPVWLAFLPVAIPILLIGIGAFTGLEKQATPIARITGILGDPVIALSIGILLAAMQLPARTAAVISPLMQEAAEKAGGILVIIGAGGAFGAVLAATGMGRHLGTAFHLGQAGIFFPFLLAALLKTAQGSSTVAIITAAAIVEPLLPALGLNDPTGRLLCMLALGGGSMMISHANDAYFWVVAKFSGVEMKAMLKVYSVATLLMGLTTLAVVYILSLILR
ncbi:GntP family permease [Chitinophaga nivalis]|uniref:GntP family permease n=1 Tax=Chitinophaga nivalis TaxID=2991709 RepID=A0ABT3IFA6_9BACT|nr:GntP family permease [Chitinophaga nivalis]MCW3467663.1 GntP family permease [Chitinophaga nivalis]MCW3482645.1 GntP family permease [Chitinophaga nivalis]